MTDRLRQPVALVMRLLAQGDFVGLARLSNQARLQEQAIRKAVSDYGRTLIDPPGDAFDLMDIVQLHGDGPVRWSISMPMWTKEEGRSDLAVELTLTENSDGFDIELNDLHVR